MQSVPVHRSGFVAVVGRPNVGKSTLLNALLGQKIAGVSPWPQTTRRRQMGILTLPSAQLIFLDTPGWHAPKDGLGRAMIRDSEKTIRDSDVVLFLADLSLPPAEEDRALAAWLIRHEPDAPAVLALNKADAVAPPLCEERAAVYRALLPQAEGCVISARENLGLGELIERISARLPEGPILYPEEEITDLSEREISADLIREAALRNLRAEVPHGVAVRIEQYKERGEGGAWVEATIFVERESHKAIVIGKGGSMLKRIGTDARRKIEAMSGRKLYLQLRVKALPGWRDREDALRRLGYATKEK
ncbi:MAG: GTPase Era [Anaerolineales bacterium]|nr:GTPase Era [Anaerolineales bacterium]